MQRTEKETLMSLHDQQIKVVNILSDCKSAIQSCLSRNIHTFHQDVIDSFHRNIQVLQDHCITVTFRGINHIADTVQCFLSTF